MPQETGGGIAVVKEIWQNSLRPLLLLTDKQRDEQQDGELSGGLSCLLLLGEEPGGSEGFLIAEWLDNMRRGALVKRLAFAYDDLDDLEVSSPVDVLLADERLGGLELMTGKELVEANCWPPDLLVVVADDVDELDELCSWLQWAERCKVPCVRISA